MSGMEPGGGGGVIYKWQVGGGWAYNRLFTVYELYMSFYAPRLHYIVQ